MFRALRPGFKCNVMAIPRANPDGAIKRLAADAVAALCNRVSAYKHRQNTLARCECSNAYPPKTLQLLHWLFKQNSLLVAALALAQREKFCFIEFFASAFCARQQLLVAPVRARVDGWGLCAQNTKVSQQACAFYDSIGSKFPRIRKHAQCQNK